MLVGILRKDREKDNVINSSGSGSIVFVNV